MKLLFATGNPAKVEELAGMVESGVQVCSLREVPGYPEVVEDGETFEANARKKAEAAMRATGIPALADDSGLCVDALSGRPGVHSNRYAPGSDRDRCEKLLAELEGIPDERRTATFECALALALPDGRVVVEHGRCHGRIGHQMRGTQGFGYDPLFLLASGYTMAELSREEKAAISHRGQAFSRMRPHLAALGRE